MKEAFSQSDDASFYFGRMKFRNKIRHVLLLTLGLLSMEVCFGGEFQACKKKDSLSRPVLRSQDIVLPEMQFKQLAVPISLMAYGTIEAALAPEFDMLNAAAWNAVNIYNPVKIHADDYIQYLPMASVYILNLCGVKGKHNFVDRTIILGMAAVFTAASVNALKYTVREQRPDSDTRNSFPSGHTAVAFMGAEFLWQEYKDVSPWYGVCGYVVAATTGALRIHNNRHWVGDVLFGAGLGMLSTKLAYYLYPRIQKKVLQNRENKKHRVEACVFAPYYNGVQGGLAAALYF